MVCRAEGRGLVRAWGGVKGGEGEGRVREGEGRVVTGRAHSNFLS